LPAGRTCAAASSTRRRGADSPIAKEALEKIGALFDIERLIVGASPEQRRGVRQRLAKPRLDEPATWLDAQLQRIPGKSDLAGAIRYAQSRWSALTAYVDHGQLEISNNAAENGTGPWHSEEKIGSSPAVTAEPSEPPSSTR
jgi:hypothetical protein